MLVGRERGQGNQRKKLVLSFKLHSVPESLWERRGKGERHYLEAGYQGSLFLGYSILKTANIWMQGYSLHVTVFNRTASSEVLPGWGVLGPGISGQGPDCQPRRLLAGPYPIWICPEYIVRTSMMLKPVKRPTFWMTKGIKTLPFLSSSWQTSFISGNWGRRKKHESCSSFLNL